MDWRQGALAYARLTCQAPTDDGCSSKKLKTFPKTLRALSTKAAMTAVTTMIVGIMMMTAIERHPRDHSSPVMFVNFHWAESESQWLFYCKGADVT